MRLDLDANETVGGAMSLTIKANAGNRRKFIRVQPEAEAPVRVDINGEGYIEVLHAIDISENGIRINVNHRFGGCDIDQPAAFVIYLPAPINKFFRAEGRIKHVRNDSFGVHFTHLSEKSRALVRGYIAFWLKRHNLWNYLRYLVGLLR